MTQTISIKDLLEAGVHFGHETKRWNPKMRKFIYAERNGIFIIDLQKTMVELEKARDYIQDIAARGGVVLYVSTKKQAQEIIQIDAERVGMPYVNQRWLGGMLTNFKTISARTQRLEELERLFESDEINERPKKEQIHLKHELERLQKYLSGFRLLKRPPDMLFVIDPTREIIAVREARKLGIPVVALADTDSDPDQLDAIIPGNDDAIRSVQLITGYLTDVIIEARGGVEVVPEAGQAEAQPPQAIQAQSPQVDENEPPKEESAATQPPEEASGNREEEVQT